MSCCKEFRRTGTVTGAKLLSWIVPYCTVSVPVRLGIVKVAFGMVTYFAVLGLSESGTVPYGNGLGRTGTVTTSVALKWFYRFSVQAELKFRVFS